MSLPVGYRILRSRRKTVSLEITPAIETHLALVRERMAAADAQERFTEAERNSLRERARPVFEARVDHFASLLGMSRGKITIRTQRSRWGSCSAQGNLSFNALLLLTPPEVLDYVVVHELCHRREMNHSPRFWAEVERLVPDWKVQRLWLRTNGGALMARLPEK